MRSRYAATANIQRQRYDEYNITPRAHSHATGGGMSFAPNRYFNQY